MTRCAPISRNAKPGLDQDRGSEQRGPGRDRAIARETQLRCWLGVSPQSGPARSAATGRTYDYTGSVTTKEPAADAGEQPQAGPQPKPERLRDDCGRTLPQGSVDRLRLEDFDALSLEENHSPNAP